MLEYILNRLREASTYAGLAPILMYFGLPEDLQARIVENGPIIAAGLAAIVAVLAPNRFAGHTGLSKKTAATDPGTT